MKTCICFRTEQLVARILSNKYIWLLLKYITEGTDSRIRGEKTYPLHITVCLDGVWKQTIALSSNSVHCFRQFK